MTSLLHDFVVMLAGLTDLARWESSQHVGSTCVSVWVIQRKQWASSVHLQGYFPCRRCPVFFPLRRGMKGHSMTITNKRLPSAHEFANSGMETLLPAFHLSLLCSASMKSLTLSAALTFLGLTFPACLTASYALTPARGPQRSFRAHSRGFVLQYTLSQGLCHDMK